MIKFLQGDCREILPTLEPESVQCCVTSPPYWGLRDYGTAQWEGGDDGCDHIAPALGGTGRESLVGTTAQGNGTRFQQYRTLCRKCGARRIDSQLGLESTPEEYIAKMVAVFREVWRVLRDDGTLWLNMGDSYAVGKQGRDDNSPEDLARRAAAYGTGIGNGCGPRSGIARKAPPGLKPKDLCMMPARLAMALQADGWYLRSDIIWHKPNPMPESVTDRPTKAHEYIFLLTKSERYYYDAEAIREERSTDRIGKILGRGKQDYSCASAGPNGSPQRDNSGGFPSENRNKRSVWTVAAPEPVIDPSVIAALAAAGWELQAVEPASVIDRPSCNHEYVFLLTKSPKYYYDADAIREAPLPEYSRPSTEAKNGAVQRTDLGLARRFSNTTAFRNVSHENGRNKRSVWTIATQPYAEAHFATFPEDLIKPCIMAGSRLGDTVLDPFAGSGTTGLVALELGRKAILIELNPEYVEMANGRTNVTAGFL